MKFHIGHAFLAVGILLVPLGGFVAQKRVYEPMSWPEVSALVVSSAVVDDASGNYTVEFTFRYAVEGIERDTTIRGAASSSSHSIAESMLRGFEPGTRVPVRVKPSDPSQVVYNPGWSDDNILFVSIVGSIAVIFAGIGIVALNWSPRDPTFTVEDYRARAEGYIPIDDRKLTQRMPYVFHAAGAALLGVAAIVALSGRTRGGGLFDWWVVPTILGIVGLGFIGFGVLFSYLSRFVPETRTATVPDLDKEDEELGIKEE